MTNGTDTAKFKVSGKDKVEDMGFQGQMAVKVTPNCVRKGTREGSRRFAGGIMIDKVESRTQI